jgi:hypothetical protein
LRRRHNVCGRQLALRASASGCPASSHSGHRCSRPLEEARKVLRPPYERRSSSEVRALAQRYTDEAIRKLVSRPLFPDDGSQPPANPLVKDVGESWAFRRSRGVIVYSGLGGAPRRIRVDCVATTAGRDGRLQGLVRKWAPRPEHSWPKDEQDHGQDKHEHVQVDSRKHGDLSDDGAASATTCAAQR